MPISPSTIQGYPFGSKAERKIHEYALKEGVFSDPSKYLFHSLSIVNTGNNKVKAEIDFVYLDSDCILFLEVKGGQVKFDSSFNQWYVMGGTEKGDPFKQAYDGLFNTRDRLLPALFKAMGVSNRLVFGVGVLFPDCQKPQLFTKYRVSNMEYDPELIFDYDDNAKTNPFGKYIDRIKKYWTAHPQFWGREGISRRELTNIANYFRQDLHFKLPISDILTKSVKEVKHFTAMQMYILDTVAYNPARGALIIGGPGTGKTMLALELLRRSLAKGNKTLFICFNRNLVDYLLLKATSMELQGEFKITNLHALLRDRAYIDADPLPIEDSVDFWPQKLPLYFSKNLKKDIIGTFDYLIVDEGQDIMNEYQIEALGKLVSGDLDSGQWAIFLDKEYQKIFNEHPEEYLEYLREAYPNITVPLVLNCRNTFSTVGSASLQTGLPKMPCMRNEHTWISIIKYFVSEKDLLNLVKETIAKHLTEGIEMKDITVLCYDNKQVMTLRDSIGAKSHQSAISVPHRINVLTIQSYKGLENEFILIIGPSNYEPLDKRQMQLLYMANTRACSQSILFINRKYKGALEENI
jgi:hypothetical protein